MWDVGFALAQARFQVPLLIVLNPSLFGDPTLQHTSVPSSLRSGVGRVDGGAESSHPLIIALVSWMSSFTLKL